MTRLDLLPPFTISALNGALIASVSVYDTWVLQVAGTWVGTLSFKGSTDGGLTYPLSLNAHVMGTLGGTTAQTATANGNWDGGCSALTHVQVVATAWTSGSATLTMLLTDVPHFVAMLSALPAGSNTIGGVNPAAGAVVAASSPPTATNAGSDTSYTFASAVRHLMVQNKTSANLYYAFDATASLGSFVLYPQQVATLDLPCTVLHFYTAAAQNINGTADLNIFVQGWA